MNSKKLKAAVITEWHPFDVVNFQRLFWQFDQFEVYIQSFDLFCQDERNGDYDVVVYYNMSIPTPDAADPRKLYIEKCLGSTRQGIVLLHHGILSYPDWDIWGEVSGVSDRNFRYFGEQSVRYMVESTKNHPATKSLTDFTLIDETYKMIEPDSASDVLITADHPNSLRSIAWVRQFKESPVFCYQSGHDQQAYGDPNFQCALYQGMLWAAGQL